MQVEFHSQIVGDVEVFYRVAGSADAPVVLLLHGFPTASHMSRDLIPELAGRYRVIAPDLPGFGNTKAPTAENREACRASLGPDAIRTGQYLHGADVSLVSPDGYTLDNTYMARPGAQEIQFDLILDYASNLALYPAFQTYLRSHSPALLAIWGRNDPHFVSAGTLTYQRDVPQAEVVLLDTGHFALETHAAEIGAAMRRFLGSHVGGNPLLAARDARIRNLEAELSLMRGERMPSTSQA